MILNGALQDGSPVAILPEPVRGKEWVAALAFCDEHGDDGPDILAAHLETSRQAHNAKAVAHWTSLGRRLVQMHGAGARAWH